MKKTIYEGAQLGLYTTDIFIRFMEHMEGSSKMYEKKNQCIYRIEPQKITLVYEDQGLSSGLIEVPLCKISMNGTENNISKIEETILVEQRKYFSGCKSTPP